MNILGTTQNALALNFAAKGETKFRGVEWVTDDGLPRLPRSPGWLACEVAEFVDGGDHVVLLGRVTSVDQYNGRPLTYHARDFGTHTPLTVDR